MLSLLELKRNVEALGAPPSSAASPGEWKWFGNAGHFICAAYCRFHLTTRVGDFLVSTVGQYVPDSGTRKILAESRGNPITQRGDAAEAEFLEKFGYETLGAWGTYETMVFRWTVACDDDACGGLAHVGGESLDGMRYENAKDATEGHYTYCARAAAGEYGDNAKPAEGGTLSPELRNQLLGLIDAVQTVMGEIAFSKAANMAKTYMNAIHHIESIITNAEVKP